MAVNDAGEIMRFTARHIRDINSLIDGTLLALNQARGILVGTDQGSLAHALRDPEIAGRQLRRYARTGMTSGGGRGEPYTPIPRASEFFVPAGDDERNALSARVGLLRKLAERCRQYAHISPDSLIEAATELERESAETIERLVTMWELATPLPVAPESIQDKALGELLETSGLPRDTPMTVRYVPDDTGDIYVLLHGDARFLFSVGQRVRHAIIGASGQKWMPTAPTLALINATDTALTPSL